MLLVIDVGNTNIVLGVYDKTELVGHWRISTDRVRTTDEYGMLMMNLFFHDRKVDVKDIKDIIISLSCATIDAYIRARLFTLFQCKSSYCWSWH